MAWTKRILNVFHRADAQMESISEELAYHIEERTRANLVAGMSPAEAHSEARRRFGNAARLQDEVRDADTFVWLDALVRDLRQAFHGLWRRPGLALTAILSLALAIGANTAIFSLVDAEVLRPVALPQAERLAVIEESFNGRATGGNSERLKDYAARVSALDSLAGFYSELAVFSAGSGPERVRMMRTLGDPLAVLGVQPGTGRGFTEQERRGTGPAVALLGEGFWTRRFGRDPNTLGRQITLSGVSYTVVGILPASLDFPSNLDVLAPAPSEYQNASRRANYFLAVGRMRAGVSRKTLSAQLDAVAQSLAASYPDTDKGLAAKPAPIEEWRSRESRKPLFILLATVLAVLLIACVNIAGLLLARGAERQREAAIRAALGAGRGGLVRLYLMESVWLSAAGAVLGLLLARIGMDLLRAVVPADATRMQTAEMSVRVLCYTLGLAVAATLAFGLAPAWHAARMALAGALNSGRFSAGGGTVNMRRGLVVAQVALSTVLLTSTALLARSFLEMRGMPLGFQPENVLTVQIEFPWDTPKTRLDSFYKAVLDELAAIPGVRAVGLADRLPLQGFSQSGPTGVRGRELPPFLQLAETGHHAVSSGYFAAMGIPLKAGRPFEQRITEGDTGEAVINETMARQYFPNGGAIGQQITFDVKKAPGAPRKWLEVVGIVGDVRLSAAQSQQAAEAFVSYENQYWPLASFVLRAPGDPRTYTSAVREAVRRVDPNQVIDSISTMRDQVAETEQTPRTLLWVLGGFAITAMLLSVIGLYGVLSREVAQGTREIGLRLALGATAGAVVKGTLGRGLQMAAAGLVLGLAGAAAATRLLESLLVNVRALDPLSFAAAASLLIAAALTASGIPAYRASRVDPMEALRHE